MLRKLRDFFRDFDREVLEKGDHAEPARADLAVKQQYEKSAYDFRGQK